MTKFEYKKLVENAPVLDEAPVRIALKIIKNFEGCNLTSYPDPASPLYKALSTHGMLSKYMAGKLKYKDLPEHFQALSGTPWTIGFGETQGITHSMEWTQEQAVEALEKRVEEFMAGVLKSAPKLIKGSPERIAACTSLAYNIGTTAFKDSTVAKMIEADNHTAAAAAFLLWNKVRENGKLAISHGLDTRRKVESALYISITA